MVIGLIGDDRRVISVFRVERGGPDALFFYAQNFLLHKIFTGNKFQQAGETELLYIACCSRIFV